MQTLKLVIENPDGIKLATRLEQPLHEKPIAYAVFAHCFTCSKNIKAAVTISRALAQKGIATLRFDFTGLGESQGDFADTNFSSNVQDLVSVARYLETHFQAPQLLIGHSLGGAAVLQTSRQLPSIKAVVTIGAPSEPSHVNKLLTGYKDEIIQKGEAEVLLAGRPFRVKKQFLDDLSQTRMSKSIQSLGRALLVMHSPIDQTVGINNAADIFMQAKHPKSFMSLDDADHLLMNPDHSVYAASIIAEWAMKYIQAEQLPEKSIQPHYDDVRVTLGKDGLTTDILAHGFSMIADEPINYGGNNQGPSPYDYCLSGLGACTAMTLKLYANRKKWHVDEISVRLTHRKIHAEDCMTCETKQGKIDEISRHIIVNGALDEDQKKRLLQIADKCPVHQTLENEVKINTTLG